MLVASLYLLPNLLIGGCINLIVGIYADRLPAGWFIVGSSVLGALAPRKQCSVQSASETFTDFAYQSLVTMALVNPNWKYYYLELWAMLLAPLSTNVIYTVVSFPEHSALRSRDIPG